MGTEMVQEKTAERYFGAETDARFLSWREERSGQLQVLYGRKRHGGLRMIDPGV
jgi:hypothetical protein